MFVTIHPFVTFNFYTMRILLCGFCFLYQLQSILILAQSFTVENLTCESKINPLGIDSDNPRFGWQINSDERGFKQSAYEIELREIEPLPQKSNKVVWKSKKKQSTDNTDILYSGKNLDSFSVYEWRVRVYNDADEVSEWSKFATFETAFLKNQEWKGEWIQSSNKTPQTEEAFYTNRPAPLFLKKVTIKKPVVSARLYITGLGYYDAYINGIPVSDQCLNPGWTNVDKQVLYNTFDVTPLLTEQENTLSVITGNGFYNPLPMPVFKQLRTYLTIGEPCLKAQLRIQYNDGSVETVITDQSWLTRNSAIQRNNVYLGEHYDARKELKSTPLPNSIKDEEWERSILAKDAPIGLLTAQIQPPVLVREVIKPVRMSEVRPGEFIFDMGKNFAGVARIKVEGPAGTVIKIRYGEDIYSDGSLNVMTSVAGQQKTVWNANWSKSGQPPTAWQEDQYTLKGEGVETWSPRFTFHGFRYIEITGWPGRPSMDQIEGLRMSADLEQTGTFECSNPMLNQLHQVIENTFLSNVFSVQSDCPAREKFGYGGDIVGVAQSFCWIYNMNNFYSKAIQDYANDQRPLGGMTETAPFNGIADMGLGDNSGPIGWQLAFAFMQKQLYDYYGDLQTIKKQYPALVKQVEFLRSNAKDHLIETCINDHESLEERIPALFATAHYYHHVILLSEFSTLLNKKKEAKSYLELSDSIKTAFIQSFVTSGNGIVGNQTQAAQAFGLYYNLLPENEKQLALAKLLEQINTDQFHIRSGIFGVPAVLKVLQDNQENETAYRMVTQKEFPGWGHMLASGATTLWETWKYSDNVYSHNHPMFGSVAAWMYESLGGILPLDKGFKEIMIKPQPVDDLNWVNCNYNSVNGQISSRWKKNNDEFELEAIIPGNSSATIYIPMQRMQQITESGIPVKECKSISFLGIKKGYACFKVGSGKYSFRAI